MKALILAFVGIVIGLLFLPLVVVGILLGAAFDFLKAGINLWVNCRRAMRRIIGSELVKPSRSSGPGAGGKL